MHVIQYIATKADNAEEAHSKVKEYLEIQLGYDNTPTHTWFDWFVAGGGRWATDAETNQYNDEYTGDVAHQDDPRFQEYLDNAHKFRWEELESYEKSAREIDLPSLLDKLQDFEHDNYSVGNALYPVKKIYDMTIGLWDYNSYFFDIEHDSTNRTHMLKSIDNGDKMWYLVPVDFHF